MTFNLTTYLCLACVCVAGCSGNTGNSSQPTSIDSNVTATDSAGEAVCVAEHIAVSLLPDTAYPSARQIIYKIDMLGDSTATISSYSDMYAETPGTFTFRKGQMRRADFGGKVSGTPKQISVDWEYITGEDTVTTRFGRWGGGTGWTGQPLIVDWPDSCADRLRGAGVVNANFNGSEIIVGSLASHIYFINPETGKDTRVAIATGNPIKGTISLDPSLNGNLYAGHGVPAREPFGAIAINLFSNTIFHIVDRDPLAWRRWDAYDSSPLRIGQYLFRPGENGAIYKFEVLPGELRLHSVMRYLIDGRAPGIEASMAADRNYGYVADNAGNILAFNLNNLKPVWCHKLGDDIDSTPVLSREQDSVYLYTGCEIDRQGSGEARFVKLNAATGEQKWLTTFDGMRFDKDEKHFDGGFYASPLPGSGNCSHLIFTNCVLNTSGQNGIFVALEKTTGEIAYTVPLKHYAWSSPVSFLNEKNEMFILTADTYGNAYLINGIDGTIIHTLHVGNNFESSPVVFGNSAVVGSRGRSIYKLSVI